MMKEKADGGDDLAKAVQDTFGEKPDSLLVRFIRARKYDVPRAFDLMKGASEFESYRQRIMIFVLIRVHFKVCVKAVDPTYSIHIPGAALCSFT